MAVVYYVDHSYKIKKSEVFISSNRLILAELFYNANKAEFLYSITYNDGVVSNSVAEYPSSFPWVDILYEYSIQDLLINDMKNTSPTRLDEYATKVVFKKINSKFASVGVSDPEVE